MGASKFLRELSSYGRDFAANLRQPDMPPGEWVSKLIRNRLRAGIVRPGGCCGHPGEPGC